MEIEEVGEGLESEFHQAMLNVYDQAAANDYHPTIFRDTVRAYGGLRAAKRWLATENPQPGLYQLAKRGCLGISMEALVMQQRWRPLFSAEEREIARKRLASLLSEPLGW